MASEVKSCSNLLIESSLIRSEVSGIHGINIQHLRRFAKGDHIPPHLPVLFKRPLDPDSLSIRHNASFEDQERRDARPEQEFGPTALLLVCPELLITLPDLRKLFAQSSELTKARVPEKIQVIQVPALAPTSQEQADQWSTQYWPTVYNKSNSYGPTPSIVSHAEAEMLPNVGLWANLAEHVALQSASKGLGERIGCVIVERSPETHERAVVVAGDARWQGVIGADEGDGKSNNVMGHAVMRAIALVANKRLRVAKKQSSSSSTDAYDAEAIDAQQASTSITAMTEGEEQIQNYLDFPLTEIEQQIYDAETIRPHGYLCLDLEIYVTHEPCVMCSMALLHSRFGRCVFSERMPLTAGLTAEGNCSAPLSEDAEETELGTLGYGLFWRPDLNWKFLTWQLSAEHGDEDPEKALSRDVHA